MKIELGQHALLLGETGAGKTYWARDYLRKCRRVLVVDTKDGLDFPPKEWPVVSLDGLKRSGVLTQEDRAFHWAFRPTPTNEEADVEALCYLLLKKARNMIVYFDEITDYSDANRCGPWLKQMFRKSRGRGISNMASSQRPAGLNHWFSENCQYKVLFYFGRYDGENTAIGRIMNEHREAVPYGSHKYLVVAPGDQVTVREKI